jgi:hypothetical protein
MATTKFALLLSFFVTYVLCDGDIFNWTIRFSFGTTTNISEAEYSPDQKYIALPTSQVVYLMEGASIFPMDSVSYGNQYQFSCFGFSQDSSMLAVGFKSASE